MGLKPQLPDQRRYHVLLRDLATLSPPAFVMGGFAEDALLFGQVTGHHADLDVLVPRAELQQRIHQLARLGLEPPTASLDNGSQDPLILGTHADQPHIELWTCTSEPGGGYSLEVYGSTPASRYRAGLPEDTFRYPATTLEDIAIQTISPLALYQLRAISAMTRHVGEKLVNDKAMGERLRQAFLADQHELQLTPTLKRL